MPDALSELRRQPVEFHTGRTEFRSSPAVPLCRHFNVLPIYISQQHPLRLDSQNSGVGRRGGCGATVTTASCFVLRCAAVSVQHVTTPSMISTEPRLQQKYQRALCQHCYIIRTPDGCWRLSYPLCASCHCVGHVNADFLGWVGWG